MKDVLHWQSTKGTDLHNVLPMDSHTISCVVAIFKVLISASFNWVKSRRKRVMLKSCLMGMFSCTYLNSRFIFLLVIWIKNVNHWQMYTHAHLIPEHFWLGKRTMWRDCVHQVRFLQKYSKLTAYSLNIYYSGGNPGLNIITVQNGISTYLLARTEAVTSTSNSKHASEFAGVTDDAILLWTKKWIAIMKIIWHFFAALIPIQKTSLCSFPTVPSSSWLVKMFWLLHWRGTVGPPQGVETETTALLWRRI